MKIKPFGAQILIKPHKKEQILLADIDKPVLCEYGEVVDIGDEVKYVKVGDIIAHTIWGVNSLEYGDEKFYFILEDERFILGVINEEK
jgi:co-chaperonin GroES (HSP10)